MAFSKLRFLLLFICLLCCSLKVACQVFDGGFYSSSDFVIYADRIGVDTFDAPLMNYTFPPAFFARGKVNRDSIIKAELLKMRKADSMEVNAKRAEQEAEQEKLRRAAKKKHKNVEIAFAPPEYHEIFYTTKRVIRYTFVIREVYKNCFDYTNQLQEAQLSNRDTISFMMLYDKMDSAQQKYLHDNTELEIYFNDAYYRDNVPAVFKTREYEKFYHDNKMYWIDPGRMLKPETGLTQYGK